MTRGSLYETVVNLSDLHVPYHDSRAIKLVIGFIKDLGPDGIILDGDGPDCYDLSRFDKNPLRILSLSEIEELAGRARKRGFAPATIAMQRELDELYKILCDLRKACPRAWFDYIYGNHEFRIESYIIRNAKEFYGLCRAGERNKPVLDLAYLLRFGDLGIRKIFSGLKESWRQYGALLVGHFDKARKHSTWTAKTLLEEKGVCILQAHTHKLGAFYHTLYDRVVVAYENGCLCDLNPRYMGHPNWQHGFTIIHKKRGARRFYCEQIPIVDYTFFYGGREYRG